MKALNVAIGMFFTMAFMGAGCVSLFASIYQAMGGNLIIAGAFFILCVCCWVLMLITLNTIMVDSGYPSSFTGKRKASPFDVVSTGSCGVDRQEQDQ
jgi:Flp pilus assembly protein protease CpaA